MASRRGFPDAGGRSPDVVTECGYRIWLQKAGALPIGTRTRRARTASCRCDGPSLAPSTDTSARARCTAYSACAGSRKCEPRHQHSSLALPLALLTPGLRAGRRAHLLPARPAGGRDRGRSRPHREDTHQVRLQRVTAAGTLWTVVLHPLDCGAAPSGEV